MLKILKKIKIFNIVSFTWTVEEKESSLEKFNCYLETAWAFISSLLVSMTRHLMKYSRDYRYVSRTLSVEKKILKVLNSIRLYGLWLSGAIVRVPPPIDCDVIKDDVGCSWYFSRNHSRGIHSALSLAGDLLRNRLTLTFTGACTPLSHRILENVQTFSNFIFVIL